MKLKNYSKYFRLSKITPLALLFASSIVAYADDSTTSEHKDILAGESQSVTGSFSGADYTGKGGAFYIEDDGQLTITDASFSDNTASSVGGAISLWSGLNSSNYAESLLSKLVGYGVLSFTNNISNSYGGAICAYKVAVIDFSNVTSINFTGNQAKYSGGSMYISGNSNITVDAILLPNSSKFYSNTAGTSGGAFYIGSNLNLTIGNKAEFVGNEATSNFGGAIYSASNLTIGEGATFKDNSAGELGGAIYITSETTIGDGAIFTENKAGINSYKYGGGAIYYNNEAGTDASISLDLNKATFTDNYADGYGGAIFVNTGLLNVSNSVFEGNISAYNGGAISTTTTQGTVLEKTTAATRLWDYEYDNGFYATNKIVISNSTFKNNGAISEIVDAAGGALGIYSDSVITYTIFEGNKAAGATISEGGAIYIGGWGRVDISNTEFTNNTSNGKGGAIATTSAGTVGDVYLYATDSTFTSNSAENGGAVYTTFKTITETAAENDVMAQEAGSVGTKFTDTTFKNNTATQNGGAIYNSGDLEIESTSGVNVVNSGNIAASGGFLYTESGATTNFNTAGNSSITIGNGSDGFDSIAGEGTITKTGLGLLSVNGSMSDFSGSLLVSDGDMSVKNGLGASDITISKGATLSASINGDYTFNSTSLNIENSGTLKLIAGATATSKAEYTIATDSSLDFDSDDIGAIAYGGTIENNTFTVSTAQSIEIGSGGATIESNGRAEISYSNSKEAKIVMSFNSTGETAVSSVTDVSSSDDFSAYVTQTLGSDLAIVEAFEFTVGDLDGGSVVLSFLVGEGYDLSQFTVFHKETGSDWEIAGDISDLTYEDGYLSFIVDSFSSYGYAAVPEPSTYAMIFGALALGLAVYRRRK